MANNTYTLISTLSDGTQLNGDSGTTESLGQWLSSQTRPNVVLSDNGRYVAFNSSASNVPGDSDFGVDVYLKDTVTGSLSLVSVSQSGSNSASHSAVQAVSSDGNWVLFLSGANDLGSFGPSPVVNASVYLKNMTTGEVFDMVPEKTPMVANSGGNDADMSSDARFVVFVSKESNVTGESISGTQAYLVDRQAGTTTMVSKDSNGQQLSYSSWSDPHVSNDGRYVIFQTKTAASALDLQTSNDIYVKDTQTGELRLVSVGLNGKAAGGENAQISGNGRYVTFISAGQFTDPALGTDPITNQPVKGVYRADLQTGAIALVSIKADGTLPNRSSYSATISDDGRYVLFKTDATSLDGVPGLTWQGSYPNYTGGEPGVWLKDMVTGSLTPIDANGSMGPMSSMIAASLTLSGDGTTVVFGQDGTTGSMPPLVPASADTNGKDDVFLTTTGVKQAVPGLTVSGTPGADNLSGSANDDTITGLDGNDRLNGLGGSDMIDGGAGTDTLVIDTPLAQITDYTFSGNRLTSFSTESGTTVLSGIERVQLPDGLFAFDTEAPTDHTPGGHVWQAAALYHAAFGVMPTTAELSQWTREADQSDSMGALASTMIGHYVPSGIGNADLVGHLYFMLTGQVAPPEALNQYAAMIGPGQTFATQGDLFAWAASLSLNTDHLVDFTGSVQWLDATFFE